MAVFMINVCKFYGCGRTFPTLGDLIRHIEDAHIDYDPAVVEQKEASRPSCLPLSYVLRFFNETSKRPSDGRPINPDVRRKLASVVKTPSVRSNTPTGSEFDEEDVFSAQSEDSNESWTNAEEFSPDFILRNGSRNVSNDSHNGNPEKPYACPVPGCSKRYKNVNGIKYHSKNGHKKEAKVRKGFRCPCGKSYKTAQGLRNHTSAQHRPSRPPTPAQSQPTQTAKPLSLPVMRALQGYTGTSQNHIVNALHQNHIRPISRLNEAPHLENTKTIRAVLEGDLQSPLLKNIANDAKTSQTMTTTSQYLTDSFISSTNSLGILTPASSPVSNVLKEDSVNVLNHSKIGQILLPLSPVTPGNDNAHDNFTVPANILTH